MGDIFSAITRKIDTGLPAITVFTRLNAALE